MNKFKKFIIHNIFNMRFWMILIVMMIVFFIITNFVKNKVENVNESHLISQSNEFDFPDKALVDPYKNPCLYDMYRGIFGAHFDASLLKRDDYKLLVLNEDSSYYIFDNYWACDDIYTGTIGGNWYKVRVDKNDQNLFEKFKENRKANYIEEFNDKKFYFFVLDMSEYDFKTNMVSNIEISRNPNEKQSSDILLYFEHFGWPASWCKLTSNQNDWLINFNDPFWDNWNYNQQIICPKNDGSYNYDDHFSYVLIKVVDTNLFYVEGDEYTTEESIERFLKENGYMSLHESVKFTENEYSKYNILLF